MNPIGVLWRATAVMALVLAASRAAALSGADLVPDAANLATAGQASVTNMGDTASEPTVLTVTCQKTSGGMGGCLGAACSRCRVTSRPTKIRSLSARAVRHTRRDTSQ